ncbi:MAG: UDP-2,4-diacetamido-2,4,6-trideoxy-beta-L-altropyranose hydrolase [Candidatus Muirbacterium halophilum]|nr:UDP-2,4-diacetamido-2,4,6-trideoxy-beta-L-altropyranose hydrolase [Candidatus Muirbacterium halophilum]MCK9477186.1 UDP-2,4-diacetamido-2,4,6-trideoxy-beta-L-altropyranose hydrolase [Candidatus Muirbacterium halophilum]
MNAVILTEGGREKGFGHITRCIALAQGFNEFFPDVNVHFIINSDNSVEKLLSEFESVEYFDWINSIEKIYERITNETIAIIDSYYAPYELLNDISEKAKICVYIDDYNRIDYPDGVIVNGTIGAENIPYNKREGQKYLLGIDYAYLRKEFWNVSDRKINKEAKKVLITFGGIDNRNLTPKLLKALNSKYTEMEKIVVIGNSYSNIDEIKKCVDNKTELVFNADAEKMKNLMIDCDFAISSAGQTIYELLATGIPSIIIGVVENQKSNIDGLIENKFLNFAGWWNESNLINNILKIINERDFNYKKIEFSFVNNLKDVIYD